MKRGPALHPSPGLGPTLAAAFVFLVFIFIPALAPVIRAAFDHQAWRSLGEDLGRITLLYRTTLALAVCVVAATLPLGVLTAVALFRLATPFRRLWLFLLVTAGFVPLVLAAGAWQACIGPNGLLHLVSPGAPTLIGFPAVVVLHAATALPWCCGIIGLALLSVDRAVEEAALLDAGAGATLYRITLPAVRPAIILAGLMAVVPVLTDMTVTDLFQVRTLAEEVYTQIQEQSDAGDLTSTLALTPLSAAIAAALAVSFRAWSAQGIVPVRDALLLPPDYWTRLIVRCTAVIGAAALIPLIGLIRQLALTGDEQGELVWSWTTAASYLAAEIQQSGRLLVVNALHAFAVGAVVVAAAIPLVWCWRWSGTTIRRIGVVVAAWLLVFPGPVLALGLIGLFQSPLAPDWFAAAYDGPLPLFWGRCVRALPYALIVLAIGMEQLDRGPFESATLAGAGPWTMLFRLAIPAQAEIFVLAWLVAASLALTELPASKLLAAPGAEPLSVRIFSLLHNGAANQQAALCLLILLLIAVLAAGVSAAALIGRRRSQQAGIPPLRELL